MDEELKLETTFTDKRSLFPRIAVAFAIIGVVGIILTMTTGISAWLLPMDETYLTVLIPTAADGSEALALQNLEHEIKARILIIHGTLLNRTDYPITDLQAVVDVRDRYSLPAVAVTVPLDPAVFPPGQMARFHAEIGMDKELGGYSVRFRLPDDGPYVPHRDERADAPAPEPELRLK